MPLILAIEPDRRQAAKVGLLIDQLRADLVFGETAENALATLGSRVPDLVLTSQLLLPKDEAALAERLRELGAAGAHVQTLVIPVLRGEESAQKKKSGGLFGRLRRGAAEHDKSQEGCDPAVFAAEVTEYLERGAAERAALAAAQAELEAAWAEQPPPAPAAEPALAPAAPTAAPGYAAIDVHPDMVIDDPEALFGEFAAIPIKRVSADAETDVTLNANTPAEDFATSATAAVHDGAIYATAADTPPAEPRRAEEDWEEIPLDVDDTAPAASVAALTDAPAPPPSRVDLTSEAVDLDAFVRELHTVPSSANAQPVIPVVDLSHVFAAGVELPEPTMVDERELLEEQRATFEAEVAAVFTDAPAIEEAAGAPEATAVEYEAATFASEMIVLASDAAPVAAKLDWSEFAPPQAMPAPTWEEPPQTDWRAAIDALPPPPAAIVRPSDTASTTEALPAVKAGWQDMLSAIRRDIKSLRTDDAAPAPPKPKPEFNAEPLVFPTRPAVAAGVLSEYEAQSAQRAREAEESARQTERLARDAQDRARAAEEALRAAAAAVETSKIVEPAEIVPVESTSSIFTATIATDLAAVAFAPAPALPAEPAPSIFDATIDTDLSIVAFEPAVTAAPAAPDLTEIFFAADPAHAAAAEPSGSLADDLSMFFATTQPAAATTVEAVDEPVPAVVSAETVAPVAPVVPVVPVAPVVQVAPVAPVDLPMVAAMAEPERVPAEHASVRHASIADVKGPQKPGKGKKKRRNGHAPPVVPPHVPAPVHRPSPEWGFFDPQSAGFGPLLARLNQAASDLRALPRR